MASSPQLAHQPFRINDDPWLWNITDVVAALCLDDGPLRSSGTQRLFPDPELLAQALIGNAISGPSLLTDLNHVSLRDELGIRALGHRTSILHYIQDLRRQSPRYLEHVRSDPDRTVRLLEVGAISGHTAISGNTQLGLIPQLDVGVDLRTTQSTDLNPVPRFSLSQGNVPLATNSLSTSSVGLGGNSEIQEDAVNMVGNEDVEDLRVSKRNHSPESGRISPQVKLTLDSCINDNVSVANALRDVRLLETSIVDGSGRKRRRLDISALAPTRAMSPLLEVTRTTRPNDTSEDDGSQHNISRDTPTTLLTEPLRPGVVIIDDQGRKRVIPVKVTHFGHGQGRTGATPQPPESLPDAHYYPTRVHLISSSSERQRQPPSLRKPYQEYLGLKSLYIDTIFYSGTALGQEVEHDSKMDEFWLSDNTPQSESESFVLSNQAFANGTREYVAARLKHYLLCSRLRVLSNQKNQVIIIPYPETILERHRQPSATVFLESPTGIVTLRMNRSKCLQNSLSRGQGLPNDPFSASNVPFLQDEVSSVDWKYLQKWGRQGIEDKILPIYGDSGSEGEYDPQTWQEMEKERLSIKPTLSRRKKESLSQAEVEEALGAAEKQMVEQWNVVKKPGLRQKAWSLWKKSRRDQSERSQIEFAKRSIDHLEKRLSKIRSEIMGTEWALTKQLNKQCRSMEASIFDREKHLWMVRVLKNKSPLTKMSSRHKASRATLKDISGIKRSSDRSSVSKSDSSSGSSDHELDDFIVEDDSIPDENSDVTTYRVRNDGDDTYVISDGESDIMPQTPGVEIKSENDEIILPGMLPVPLDELSVPSNSKYRFKKEPDFIDLTQKSDSLSEETSSAKAPSTKPFPRLQSYQGDIFTPSRKKPAVFKRAPSISRIISIDSDPVEGPVQDAFDFSDSYEVNNIFKLDPAVFVKRKDRKRLLFWTIEHASIGMRNKITHLVQNSSFKEARSTVWAGLTVLNRNRAMKLPGLDEEDSKSSLLLAVWYVCWTIPVIVNSKGIQERHLRTTLLDEAGFSGFFEFLKRALKFFENSSVDRNIKKERNKRTLAPQDQPEQPLSSPHKQRKYAVPESDKTKGLRAHALLRVQERDKRQKLLKRRFIEMGVNDEDASKVIVNPGKLDDQSFIYLNSKIADRIQPHQIEGVRFMWREVIADHQGCLLAQTMGLGKTMQVITLLVTIAEASRSTEENIRDQVPADLRKSRTLILCPPGLIENWWDEFLMWTPLPLIDNIGELRKVTATLKVSERLWEIQAWKEEGGVVLLGFHTFRDLVQNKVKPTGKKMLTDEQHEMVTEALLKWPNIVVADEAHMAKTAGSGINLTLNKIESMTRIALTGSPLANNLEEYHSLIDWIAPGYLGTPLEFKANYVEKIQAGLWQDSTSMQYRDSLKRLEALKQELAPKVHRADITVLQGRLKEKQEFVIRVPLTSLQEEIYRVYVETMSTIIKDQVRRKSTTTAWAWLATLRLLCNHPKCFRDRLLPDLSREDSPSLAHSVKRKSKHASIWTDNDVTTADEADTLEDAPVSEIGISQMVLKMQLASFDRLNVPVDSVSLSNKMQILMDILQFSKQANDKLLIFSHSLHTLNYVETQLKDTQTKYSRIDGKVPTDSRQQITKNFNNDDTEVCLISTRAGGQGLNLFGANRVVIIDDHFNPMYEEQAIGRAYRIGQLKPVFVYHLMVGGTFEEILHNQSVFKQQLAKRVVDKKNPARRALRGIGEYLLPPKEVEQRDLRLFEGKDVLVLDRILASQNE
jgi:SNF2 family DNA or RNA helicase